MLRLLLEGIAAGMEYFDIETIEQKGRDAGRGNNQVTSTLLTEDINRHLDFSYP